MVHELEQVKVKVNNQELVRSKKVKCLGVVDDGLMWKEQVVNVRRKCFAGLAKLRGVKDILPSDTNRKIYNAIILPHLDYCCVVWQECSLELQRKIESIQNYGMRLILSKPARTPSDELRKAMRWAPLERRRKMFGLFLVHRCVTGKAPQCLGESLKTNSEVGNRRTRGLNNFFLPSINSEFFRSLFQFKGSQDWNSLPSGLKVVKSRSTFKTQLKDHIQQQYFMSIL